MNEFKKVPGYKIEIKLDGTIRSLVTGNILKHGLDQHGYKRVYHYRDDGKRAGIMVHRAMALAFIPNPENKPEVNHINGIKSDFSLENLEWVTHKENIQHARRTGLFKRKTGKPEKVIRNKMISDLCRTGNYTLDDIAEVFGVSQPRISAILQTAARIS